jgi:methylated-DNA-[protein]-cysteine S-methyltransferase
MTSLAIKTYELLKTVPKGKVTTYKALADALGTKAYRAIGQFMRTNPYGYMDCHDMKKRVPCHRVVAANGTIGGFMGKSQGLTIQKKIAMLQAEGVTVEKNKVVDFANHYWQF